MRLNEIELAKVDVMAFEGSREQWFRDTIQASARRLEPILEAAINGFTQAARAAVEDGDKATGGGISAAHFRVLGGTWTPSDVRPCNEHPKKAPRIASRGAFITN